MTEPSRPAEDPLRHGLPSALLHDLRTPLNQVIGYSELMMEQAQEEGHDHFVPHLQKVRAAGYQLLDLIDQNFYSVRSSPALPEPLEESARVGPEGGGARPEASGPDLDPGRAHLLVVEDNEANRDVLCRRLEQEGYTMTTAESGREALEMMRAESFDLVLLDLMMPDMAGYEVLRRVKADARLSHLPIIVISALSDLDSVARCIEMGADDYLPKPFDAVLLKARIAASLERKLARDRETRLFEKLRESNQRLQELERSRGELAM